MSFELWLFLGILKEFGVFMFNFRRVRIRKHRNAGPNIGGHKSFPHFYGFLLVKSE